MTTDSVFPPGLISIFAVIGFCWSLLAAGVVIEWIADRIMEWVAGRRQKVAGKTESRAERPAAHSPGVAIKVSSGEIVSVSAALSPDFWAARNWERNAGDNASRREPIRRAARSPAKIE